MNTTLESLKLILSLAFTREQWYKKISKAMEYTHVGRKIDSVFFFVFCLLILFLRQAAFFLFCFLFLIVT